jgi:YVTN family beta-propeller protein
MKSKQFRISTIEVHETESGHAAVRRSLIVVTVFLLAGAFSPLHAQDKSNGPAQASSAPAQARSAPPRTSQTYTQEGVAVEFSLEPISARKDKASELLAGAEATVRFKVSDTNEGKGISNLHPTAWIDRRERGQSLDARECREKIQAFLQPSFSRRAVIDLNTYFVLSLNQEASISVIDPLGGFGGSKLYMMVALRSSGEDWVLSADKKRLYVSMPLANAVAVIDTTTWKLIANIDAGVKPARIALQNDGKYLWAGNDAADETGSGVTVIDTESLKVAAQLKTGVGHHEIAFAADDSRAFITNKQDGTLSVIDVRTLAKIADIKVGGLPVAVVFSSLSKAIYVANEGEGTIVVVDGLRREILARIKAEPGLRALRIVPDGRFGFAVNPATNRVYIFDISSSRLTHVVPVGPGADQITFTSQFAYVRAIGSEFVMMIKIADLDKEADVAVTRFPAGQKAPKDSPVSSLADAVIPAPGEDAVLVANPADRMIYFYTEGMAAPMGSFQNYSRVPKALLILDNSLVETARGVYTTTIRLPDAGHYDVAFLLDSPRVVNCFNVAVADNPALPKETAVALKVEQLNADAPMRAGESYSLRFKVTDLATKQPRADIADMGVLVMLAPGIWQQREWARPRGDGVYEMSFVPPQAGVYYVYFQSPALGLRLNQISPLTLQAIER